MQGQVVQRDTIPPRLRVAAGMYAQVLATLLDLKRDEAYELPCRDRKHAQHIHRSVADIAKKEGLRVHWERNQEATRLYLWIATGEAK